MFLQAGVVVEHVGLEFLQHILVVHNQLLGGVSVGNVGQHTQGLFLHLPQTKLYSIYRLCKPKDYGLKGSRKKIYVLRTCP